MAYEIPEDEPAQIRAGDTIKWRKSLANYPVSEGWELSYKLINASNEYDITAGTDGDTYLVNEPAVTTAGYAAGDYNLVSQVTLGDDRYTLGQTTIKVLPNLAAQSSGLDTRSNAKKMLDLLDAAMLAKGSQAWTESYSIAGRDIKFRNLDEFMNMRSRLQREVKSEENADRIAQGLKPKNKIQVRF
jgi:hypothetical protein